MPIYYILMTILGFVIINKLKKFKTKLLNLYGLSEIGASHFQNKDDDKENEINDLKKSQEKNKDGMSKEILKKKNWLMNLKNYS